MVSGVTCGNEINSSQDLGRGINRPSKVRSECEKHTNKTWTKGVFNNIYEQNKCTRRYSQLHTTKTNPNQKPSPAVRHSLYNGRYNLHSLELTRPIRTFRKAKINESAGSRPVLTSRLRAPGCQSAIRTIFSLTVGLWWLTSGSDRKHKCIIENNGGKLRYEEYLGNREINKLRKCPRN